MKKIVSIENLCYKNGEYDILKCLSINFFEGISVFISGTSSGGKTTLLKAIDKKIDYTGKINVYKPISIVYDEKLFLHKTVENELHFLALPLSYQQFIKNLFNEQELKQNPNSLNFIKQKELLICKSIINKPKAVFVDNVFSYFSKNKVKMFLKFFKQEGINVMSISNDIEEALLFDYMIIMDNGMVAIEGKTKEVLKEEKLLKRLGVGLPFYVDLSIQLKYYNLIDSIYYDKEKLVKNIWK